MKLAKYLQQKGIEPRWGGGGGVGSGEKQNKPKQTQPNLNHCRLLKVKAINASASDFSQSAISI